MKDSVTGSVTVIYTFLPYGYALNCIAAKMLQAQSRHTRPDQKHTGDFGPADWCPCGLNHRLSQAWSRTKITCDYGLVDQNPRGTISEILVRSRPPRTKIPAEQYRRFWSPGSKSPGPKFGWQINHQLV